MHMHMHMQVLVDFLTIGCSVLLSDVDVLWMTNPFPHLYRDADVEGSAARAKVAPPLKWRLILKWRPL